MWKFQDFSAIQILREINFGHFEASKTVSMTILTAVKFELLGTLDIFKSEIFPKPKFLSKAIIKSLQNCKNSSLWPSEISRN